jgi:hypothetical protein
VHPWLRHRLQHPPGPAAAVLPRASHLHRAGTAPHAAATPSAVSSAACRRVCAAQCCLCIGQRGLDPKMKINDSRISSTDEHTGMGFLLIAVFDDGSVTNKKTLALKGHIHFHHRSFSIRTTKKYITKIDSFETLEK